MAPTPPCRPDEPVPVHGGALHNQVSRPPHRVGPEPPRGVYLLTHWSIDRSDWLVEESPDNEELWTAPFLDGITVRVFWRDLQPKKRAAITESEGWRKIADHLELARTHGKRIRLMIGTGVCSPEWLLEASVAGELSLGLQSTQGVALFPAQLPESSNSQGERAIARYPVPWDPVYEERYFAFLDELFAALDCAGYTRTIDWLSVTGPGSHNGEVLHVKNEDMAPGWSWELLAWLSGGAYYDLWFGAWERALKKYASLCGPRRIYYTLAFTYDGTYPPGPGNTADGWRFKKELVACGNGLKQHAEYFGLQTNGLDDRWEPRKITKRHWRLVKQHAEQGRFAGFQTRG